jgi:hypothetical protein
MKETTLIEVFQNETAARFKKLDAVHRFNLHVNCKPGQSLCPRYLAGEGDSLARNWGAPFQATTAYVEVPEGRERRWRAKARFERDYYVTSVLALADGRTRVIKGVKFA